MSFLEMFNFSNIIMLISWLCVLMTFNVLAFVRKKSMYSLVTLITSLILLIIHIGNVSSYGAYLSQNIITDFISIIISISLYLYVDDIESRRKVISEVFENKYKNRSKK